MSKSMKLLPRISEQTFGQAEELTTYVFEVPGSANKHTVKAAVESQFEVKVIKVNTATLKGKPKSSVQKRKQPMRGSRSAIKKAYVTLAEGQKIPVYEEAK